MRRAQRLQGFAGAALGIPMTISIFWLFETRAATVVMGICLCQRVVFALHASFMADLFGTDGRYSGVSLGSSLGPARRFPGTYARSPQGQ